MTRKRPIANKIATARALPCPAVAWFSIALIRARPPALFLGDRADEVGVEARTERKAFQVFAQACHFQLLVDDDEGAGVEDRLFKALVHIGALAGILLQQGCFGLL